jgi:single-stranded DNA-binding protein
MSAGDTTLTITGNLTADPNLRYTGNRGTGGRARTRASHPATAKNYSAARGWPHEERNHLARAGAITG